MLLAVPKYGNDDDYVDLLTRDATDLMINDMPNYCSWAGGNVGAAILSVTQNVAFGTVCGATPDGRKMARPTADSAAPSQGTDKLGPTATIKSVAKINHVGCDVGTQLNQRIAPQIMADISGLRKLAQLIRVYFDRGGQHIQFNIVSAETLRDAQKQPENYSDLMVRVAGYSAFFTPLDPQVQNDIIARTEQQL
jgi:formate C-acetyltransferase